MTWICDTCREAINTPDNGWLEWKSVNPGTGNKRGFRLVHDAGGPYNNRCMYDERQFAEGESLADLPLESFLGQDGLMTLLEFLSDSPEASGEIIEIIKRLHIEGYEMARRHFDSALRDGVFERNTKPGFYAQRDIKATLDWVATNPRD